MSIAAMPRRLVRVPMPRIIAAGHDRATSPPLGRSGQYNGESATHAPAAAGGVCIQPGSSPGPLEFQMRIPTHSLALTALLATGAVLGYSAAPGTSGSAS